MRKPTEIETPLLLLRDELRKDHQDIIKNIEKESFAWTNGFLQGMREVILKINSMLDIATLGDFDGCKTQPIEGE